MGMGKAHCLGLISVPGDKPTDSVVRIKYNPAVLQAARA